jgi:hypothetical protein
LPACLAVLLAACSAVPAGTPWFIGTFAARPIDGGGTTRTTVTCVAPSDCEFVVERPAAVPERIRTTGAQHFDAAIPNNNLERTRSVVAADLALYDHRDHGPLLRALRPVLEGRQHFSDCIDLSQSQDRSLAMCALGSGAAAVPLLLVTTMNPSCGRLPFCAYYFFPMERRERAGP